MSKAFTKEDDENVPNAPARRLGVPVPVPNVVTPRGLAALREELARGGDPDRMRELHDHLATAEVIEPERDVVGVGASVTVEDEDGKRTTYRIVGALEADPKHGAVSWQSPLAQALWGARVGDGVTLPRSEGEIVAIVYE